MAVSSKELFTYNNLVHAVAGAVGSMVGMIVFYPLDTVRCRLQLEDRRKARNTLIVMRELIEEEGVSTLYRGIVPVLQSLCASNFVYFYVYHGLKNTFQRSSNNHLLMATIAGAVNVLITGPLWLVNTRMKMAGITNGVTYENLIDGLKQISKSEGCGMLWSGTIPSLILVSNPAIHMAVYEFLKRRVRKDNAFSYFILSAMAKITATIATYPIQLAQAKQRESPELARKTTAYLCPVWRCFRPIHSTIHLLDWTVSFYLINPSFYALAHGHSLRDLKSSIGMIQILILIIRKEGPTGLFKGMEAKLLQTVLTTALMFMCYEKIASFVFRIMKK